MARAQLHGRLRRISYRSAKRCELGGQVRCHCRCGGKFHGARRVDFDVTPGGLSTLPESDPHFVHEDHHPPGVVQPGLHPREEFPHDRTRSTARAQRSAAPGAER